MTINLLRCSTATPASTLPLSRLSHLPRTARRYSSRNPPYKPDLSGAHIRRNASYPVHRLYSTNQGQQDENTFRVQSSGPGEPTIEAAFEKTTGTWQYVVSDPQTSTAVLLDPVLDYDRATQSVTTGSADALLNLVKANGYTISMILETHIHADHITAASYLQSRIAQEQGKKVPIGIGARMERMQKMFGERYGIPAEEYTSVFAKLFTDDEVFKIGQLSAMAIHLPGHTPDHLGYKIGGEARPSISSTG